MYTVIKKATEASDDVATDCTRVISWRFHDSEAFFLFFLFFIKSFLTLICDLRGNEKNSSQATKGGEKDPLWWVNHFCVGLVWRGHTSLPIPITLSTKKIKRLARANNLSPSPPFFFFFFFFPTHFV